MSSEFDEHLCQKAEENLSNLSTSPGSYMGYNSRYTTYKKQKSSLGKLRLGGRKTLTVDLSTENRKNETDDSQSVDPFTAKTPHLKETLSSRENGTDKSQRVCQFTAKTPHLKETGSSRENETDDSQRVHPFTAKTPHFNETGSSRENETDDSQRVHPLTAKTPHFNETGSSWMCKTLINTNTCFNNGTESAILPLKPVENCYKLPDSNFERPLSNICENDSGLDISYPSNTKHERPSSIFDSTVCKRNIQFNTPSKEYEDKENLYPFTEGKNNLSGQDSSKKTRPSTKLGLFNCKIQDDVDNINDGKKIITNNSNENEQLKTCPQKIRFFNQRSNLFKNTLQKSNITNTDIPEANKEIQKSQLQDIQPKITLFDSNPNLFHNRLSNFNLDRHNKPINPDNLKDTETSQRNKNQGVTLFDPKPNIIENQLLSHSQESLKQHSNNYTMKSEINELQNYKPSAQKIFETPFIFAANSKPEYNKESLSDESLTTPLDLSSGGYLNRTNNTQQNSFVNLLENSTSNINGAASMIGEIVNDSGINVSEQVKVNSQDHLEFETEMNLLPTALILSSRNSGNNSSKLDSDNTYQSVFFKHKNVEEQTPINSEVVLNNECNKLQVTEDISLLQSEKSAQQEINNELKNARSCKTNFKVLKEQKSPENISMEVDEFEIDLSLKKDDFYLPFNQNVVDLKKQKPETNPIHQSIAKPQETITPSIQPSQNNIHSKTLKSEILVGNIISQNPSVDYQSGMQHSDASIQDSIHQANAKPKEKTITPSLQSLQNNINVKASKSEVLVENIISQNPCINYQPGIKHPDALTQGEKVIYDSIRSTNSEIPQIQSIENENKILHMLSTNLNKHCIPTTKIDLNQKNLRSQFLSSTSLVPDKESKMLVPSKPKENDHQNLFVPKPMILLPAHQPDIVLPRLEPNNVNNQFNSSILPKQNLNLHQQPIASSNIHNKPLLQKTPVAGYLPRSQDYRLHHVHPYKNSVEFIKPVNPAPRSIDRLSVFKPPEQKRVLNMQSNYGGISTRMNQSLYVNNKGYTILSTLGRGGSSEVYQVLDPNTSNLMAVKCVDLKMVDQSIAEGYLNEIDLLLKLQGCTTVIKMFDHEYVKETKMLYVVMEKGDTDLSKLIRETCKTTTISMSMIIYYWTEMLTAVRDIHKRGIIHSDLKPANFLLVSGRLKLIDFGIASSLQGDMTSVQKEVTSGTWNYMSPEAIRNNGGSGQGFKITYRSDVWSLGCILYNLIYGKTPFSHITHTWSKLQAIADSNHKIEFPHSNTPPVLDRALKSCFHRDPKQRPTVAQLLELPYHTTFDQVFLGQEVKKLLSEESWTAIQHLFIEPEKPQTK